MTNAEAVEWLYDELGDVDACRQLDIRWWKNANGELTSGEDGGASHGKFLSVDECVAFVGSANMDFYSFDISREVVTVVDNCNLVSHWNDVVFDDMFASGEPVDQLAQCPETCEGSCECRTVDGTPPLAKDTSACTSAVCAELPECCTTAWDETCVAKVKTTNGACRGTCYDADADAKKTCAHSECVAGVGLDPSCSPCAASVCSYDAFAAKTSGTRSAPRSRPSAIRSVLAASDGARFADRDATKRSARSRLTKHARLSLPSIGNIHRGR